MMIVSIWEGREVLVEGRGIHHAHAALRMQVWQRVFLAIGLRNKEINVNLYAIDIALHIPEKASREDSITLGALR